MCNIGTSQFSVPYASRRVTSPIYAPLARVLSLRAGQSLMIPHRGRPLHRLQQGPILKGSPHEFHLVLLLLPPQGMEELTKGRPF